MIIAKTNLKINFLKYYGSKKKGKESSKEESCKERKEASIVFF
ncbi:MAG: hypothetical protein WC662_04330 [Candidatus Paceibacterota bacterium]